MTRREARETLFSLIYEMECRRDDSIEEILALAKEYRELKTDAYITDSFYGIRDHLSEIDSAIAKYAHGWKMNRISGVSLAILRLCIYEIRFNDSVPDSVAMNEAVELAKKFDDDAAPAFINGVVNAAAKEADGDQNGTDQSDAAQTDEAEMPIAQNTDDTAASIPAEEVK